MNTKLTLLIGGLLIIVCPELGRAIAQAPIANGAPGSSAPEAIVGQPIYILEGHADVIICAAFSPDGKKALTGSRDATARLWDAQDGAELKILAKHASTVTDVAFNPTDGRIYTVSSDRRIGFWSSAGDSVGISDEAPFGIYSITFAADGKKFAVGTGTLVFTAFAPHPAILVIEGGKPLTTMGETFVGFYTSLAFSPSGEKIISANTGIGNDKGALWDVRTGKRLREVSGASSVAYSPDGTKVGLASKDIVYILEVESWKQVQTLSGQTGSINSVAFSPDSAYVATAASDATARLWKIATGRTVSTFKGHTGSINAVVFSPDGSKILTGSSDKTARLWNSGLQSTVTPDPIQVIETPTVQPIYGEPPQKENGKDSLIVVTHGWRPDITWVEAMTNAITTYLVANGLKNWQVHAHKWVEKAKISKLEGGPEKALYVGEDEGKVLGQRLAANKWTHIHLLAHSAGAGLIETASRIVKTNSSGTAIHTTFLDAYVGFIYGGRNKYGKGADWSDSYFSRDSETGGEIYQLTEGSLDFSYNVDVTYLDPQKLKVDGYISTSGGVSEPCLVTVTTHGWPIDFYSNTITGTVTADYQGFGFPLSREGGNWDFATNSYKVGNNLPLSLGTPDPSCTEYLYTSTPAVIGPIINFSDLPSQQSLTGFIQKNGGGIRLTTGSPAWLATFITVTSPVNLVSFEAKFTSINGAQGLLSVYWNTNTIGSIDERVTSPGIRQYTFPLPETARSGTRTLGFRLDAFSAIQSSIMVTDVALGSVGMREPFSLSFTNTSKNGLPVLQLTGPSGFNYRVETSTNLIDWRTMAILVNTNGLVRFVDRESKDSTARFYRAVVP